MIRFKSRVFHIKKNSPFSTDISISYGQALYNSRKNDVKLLISIISNKVFLLDYFDSL